RPTLLSSITASTVTPSPVTLAPATVAWLSVVPTLRATAAPTLVGASGALVALPSARARSLEFSLPRTVTVPWATTVAPPPMVADVSEGGMLTAIAAATVTDPSFPGLPGLVIVFVVVVVVVTGGGGAGCAGGVL